MENTVTSSGGDIFQSCFFCDDSSNSLVCCRLNYCMWRHVTFHIESTLMWKTVVLYFFGYILMSWKPNFCQVGSLEIGQNFRSES